MIRTKLEHEPDWLTRLDAFISSLIGPELLDKLVRFGSSRISERTAKGIDANGQRFMPYSEEDAFLRRSKGHPANGANLFFSGQLDVAMDCRVMDDEAEIFFSLSDQAARVRGLMQGRKERIFFALQAQDIREMTRITSKHIKQRMLASGLS